MQGFFEKFLNRFLVFEKPKNQHFQGVRGTVPIHATLRSHFSAPLFARLPRGRKNFFLKYFVAARSAGRPRPQHVVIALFQPRFPTRPAPRPDHALTFRFRRDFPIPSRLSQKISRKVLTPKKCYGCNQIEGKVVSMKLFRSKQG